MMLFFIMEISNWGAFFQKSTKTKITKHESKIELSIFWGFIFIFVYGSSNKTDRNQTCISTNGFVEINSLNQSKKFTDFY